MGMRFECAMGRTGATPEAWGRELPQFAEASIYQTWEFGAVRWGEKNLSHLTLREGARVSAMAQVRLVRHRLLPGGIAYVRWGPLCEAMDRPLDASVCRDFVAAIVQEYVHRRRFLLRIVPNAFVGTPRAESLAAILREHGLHPARGLAPYRTFLLDLQPSVEVLRRQLDGKWRNQLNRAEKNGLEVVCGSGPELWQAFARLYRQMWSRKQFATTVNIDDFARIQQLLPERLKMLVFVCRQQQEPLAALVCSAIGSTGIYLLGATSDQALKLKAAYLLQWSAIRWLSERGFRYYDLGGTDPEANPGVHHFKAGLSGGEVTHLPAWEGCRSLPSRLLGGVATVVQTRFRPRRGSSSHVWPG
jgi:hypothetical protein